MSFARDTHTGRLGHDPPIPFPCYAALDSSRWTNGRISDQHRNQTDDKCQGVHQSATARVRDTRTLPSCRVQRAVSHSGVREREPVLGFGLRTQNPRYWNFQ